MSGSHPSQITLRAVVPNQSPRRVYKLIIPRQLHCIAANYLRTSASDFFGINEDTPAQGDSRASTTNLTQGCPASRSTLLNFVDSLVLKFNAADFDSIAATLLTACSDDVISHTDLDPVRFVNRKEVETPVVGEIRSPPTQLRGVASFLLVLMLLHESHPDGVMQIIDKRICYRTVLCASRNLKRRVQATGAALNEIGQSGNNCLVTQEEDLSRERNVRRGGSEVGSEGCRENGKPVSIVEVIIKFSGTCITSRPLQDVFHDLACGPVPVVPCALFGAQQLRTESEESHDTDIFGWYVSAHLSFDSSRNVCSKVLGDDTLVQRQKTAVDDDVPYTVAPTVGYDEVTSTTMGEVKRLKKGKRKVLALLHERSRKYLLELRAVFDEHDIVTEWSTIVLAAESYRSDEANG